MILEGQQMSLNSFLASFFTPKQKPNTIEKPVEVPKEPELVVPADEVSYFSKDFKKYYKCKCSWYLPLINEYVQHFQQQRSGDIIAIQNYHPPHSAQETFERNGCCPKCGKDKEQVKILKGREVHRKTRTGRIEERKIYDDCGTKVSRREKYIYFYENTAFDHMEWMESEPQLIGDATPEYLPC